VWTGSPAEGLEASWRDLGEISASGANLGCISATSAVEQPALALLLHARDPRAVLHARQPKAGPRAEGGVLAERTSRLHPLVERLQAPVPAPSGTCRGSVCGAAARERLGDLDGGPEGCGGAVLRLPPQRLQFRLRDTSETLPRTLRAVCRAARGIGGAWNICSCTSVIGISSERRIITAVRKWCPVPSAPATKIRFVGATPGALPPPPSADARAYGLWTRRGRVTGHGGVEVGCGGVSRGGRVAARLERSRRRGAVRCV